MAEPEETTEEAPEEAAEDVEKDPTAESKTAKLATDPRLISVARALRKALPGDANFGDDPLSTAGDEVKPTAGPAANGGDG